MEIIKQEEERQWLVPPVGAAREIPDNGKMCGRADCVPVILVAPIVPVIIVVLDADLEVKEPVVLENLVEEPAIPNLTSQGETVPSALTELDVSSWHA
jgi:hypothetical protein